MKLDPDNKLRGSSDIAAYTGVWIETLYILYTGIWGKIAPCTGAWIETLVNPRI
ncbi:hypothetical protein [Brevibacillus laterosporus]|uniref:Uncharacterized protein n=1 Tax=Brevibacillus laterosporus TaxID=1465 RepID=A0AAP3DEC7_BRELA|nr:hypothetical protein [Brevibacillus laterosporus]MCR8979347.1 hypothetical protein [Brevibacillus laterosporus]MCZ0806503.1 hypothetical protein [Brevibacillus laterosporus]MCZ0824762.1 hypothetical protein [Brevibacillus laterosporus]MCZ0848667.1 hypothetical protein [Brevibacillus laterosporus]